MNHLLLNFMELKLLRFIKRLSSFSQIAFIDQWWLHLIITDHYFESVTVYDIQGIHNDMIPRCLLANIKPILDDASIVKELLTFT